MPFRLRPSIPESRLPNEVTASFKVLTARISPEPVRIRPGSRLLFRKTDGFFGVVWGKRALLNHRHDFCVF